jgi:ribose 5-phosphate isomerase A
MSGPPREVDAAARKRAAAEAAVAAEVRSGMAVGLGTGSTAGPAVEAIGRLLREGTLREVRGVPTSRATAELAHRCGVPVTTLDELPELDLALDGADEIAPGLDLVKGLGGALLHEKVVAAAARRFVVVADDSKRVGRLGERAAVPVEVIAFALEPCRRRLAALGCEPALRQADDGPYATQEGNRILDCRFGPIDDAERVAAGIRAIPGVVEHGLFLRMAHAAYVATPDAIDLLGR